jgi:hypothetical protein
MLDLIVSVFSPFRPTSRQFWSQTSNYNEVWGSRALLAARYISPNSTVLDVGCGHMQRLREHLPMGCTYVPADVTKWTDEVHQLDLDADQFPPGTYDFAVMLGVLEYLTDPGLALKNARATCGHLITSYCHPRHWRYVLRRRRRRWINDFSEVALRDLLASTGWSISDRAVRDRHRDLDQLIYCCKPAQALEVYP